MNALPPKVAQMLRETLARIIDEAGVETELPADHAPANTVTTVITRVSFNISWSQQTSTQSLDEMDLRIRQDGDEGRQPRRKVRSLPPPRRSGRD